MYRERKILAIIPARAGSRGLVGKNIKLLHRKPLIAWTINEALKSRYLDKIIVSTEDAKIAEIARRYGAEVPFLRPKKLAADDSPTIDTILHALGWFGKKGVSFDYLVLLEPTSPLRKKDDLDHAIIKLIDNSNTADSLVSVGRIGLENPYITKLIVKGYVKPLIKIKSKGIVRRQQLPDVYFPYGVIYASKVETLKNALTFYQKKTIPYFIERWQNYEIDDIWDFKCVEAVLKEKREEK